MTRIKSKILRKFMDCSKVEKMCTLFLIVAVIIGTILGVTLGYYEHHQEPLTQEEIDEMYNIAVSAKESELIIDNHYIITISDGEISVETHDSCKGIMRMDLAGKDSSYKIEYRYSMISTVYMCFCFSIVFFAMIYVFLMAILGVTFYVSDKIKRVIKKE